MIDVSVLDPRELTAHRAFLSHGVAIGVRTNDSLLLERLPSCLPPGYEPLSTLDVDAWFSLVRQGLEGGGRVLYRLYEGMQLLNEGFRLTRVLERLDSAIREQIGWRAPERLFVHAGAVVWNGCAIVLPGRSGAGKTTLVEALVRAGAAYCSDEYAVIDAQGLVYPYARPMSVRQGPHRRLRKWAADFGAQTVTDPHPIGLMVETAYQPTALWKPRTISTGEGALAMFSNTLGARERPAFAFAVLSRAVHDVVCLKGNRADANLATIEILEATRQIHTFNRLCA